MTHSRREELRKILPKKKIIHRADWEKEPKFNANRSGYNKAIDDCLQALEDKVVLRSEINNKLCNIITCPIRIGLFLEGQKMSGLVKEEIHKKILEWYNQAQQIHDRQKDYVDKTSKR